MTIPDGQPTMPVTQGWATRSDLRATGTSVEAIRHRRSVGRWRSPYRGVYEVEPSTHLCPDLLAAHLHLGSESFAVLTSAIALHQIEGCPKGLAPQFAVPPGLEKAQRADIDLHFWRVSLEERIDVLGVPATTVVRTLADSARLLSRDWAVACLDSALHQGKITQDDLPAVRA